MLAGLPGGAAPSAPASKYTGGFLAALSPGAEPTLALAYEAKGGLSDVKATATAAGKAQMHTNILRTLCHCWICHHDMYMLVAICVSTHASRFGLAHPA